MEALLRRWKLLALKYKRESAAIHEKITEMLIKMQREEIIKLNIGNFNYNFIYKVIFKDNILTKYETIVLDSHDTLEDVLAGILNDDEDHDEESEDHMDEVRDINEETSQGQPDTLEDGN